MLGPDHAPLSKRHGATSVVEFRARGYLPEALVNYLALLGWSPGGGDELLPLDELARRFSLEGVSHSAGVFDVEKLAWANRHYLKAAPTAAGCATLSLPYLREAGYVTSAGPAMRGRRGSTGVLPIATDAIDRLDQAPGRLHQIFHFDAGSALVARRDPRGVRGRWRARCRCGPCADARDGPAACGSRRLPRGRPARARSSGQKGQALFHPIRVALTGETEGPELDLLVPAIDTGATQLAAVQVSRARIVSCRDRARRSVRAGVTLAMIIYGLQPRRSRRSRPAA